MYNWWVLSYDWLFIVVLNLSCFFLFSVVTGSTDGIGKSYAEEVGNFQDLLLGIKIKQQIQDDLL